MRFNFRPKVKIGNREFTIFIMISDTQTLEGITSLLPNGLHYPFFDIENCSLSKAEFELGKIQVSYDLPNIYLTSDMEGSFRSWCFGEIEWTDYLRMQLDLIDAGILDYNFFYWTVKSSKGTLRTGNKKNRPAQKLVSVLESYPVPFPVQIEKVIYDTGVQKRGLTVFLGEKGKIICGDK